MFVFIGVQRESCETYSFILATNQIYRNIASYAAISARIIVQSSCIKGMFGLPRFSIIFLFMKSKGATLHEHVLSH